MKRAAIVGIGTSPHGINPDWTGEHHALAATREALANASLSKSAIDGLVTCKALNGTGGDVAMGRLIGLNPAYSATLDYGTCNFSIQLAAMVIGAGLAETVLLTYGTDQGTRGGNFAKYGGLEIHNGIVDSVGSLAAMIFRRYLEQHGAREEDLGAVVVSQRNWARLNPGAIYREELTIDDYMAQPYHIAPVRPLDIAPFSDGGVALIMTSAERAKDMPHIPVEVAGMAQTAQLRGIANKNNLERGWMKDVAQRAMSGAGIAHDGLDLLMIQDAASVWVLQMIEAMGFVEPGGAGEFFASGAGGPGGRLPVNTSGGQLSESYMWGWLHIVEIVRQLRGDAGARQVAGAQHAMHASTMVAQKGSATVYRRAQ